MKRILAYLIIVLGLGLIFSGSTFSNEKDAVIAMCLEKKKSKQSKIELLQ